MAIIEQLMEGGGKTIDVTPVLKEFSDRVGCDIALLQAILEVESNGTDYDGQGRLIILPEKHIFYRKLPKSLKAKALASGLAARNWSKANYKGLGAKGDDRRWSLMSKWAKVDEQAALLSASYAAPQIMGFNYKICGFASVTDFVLALSKSSEQTSAAFLAYLENCGLADELRDGDVPAIVRRYNGTGQVDAYSAQIYRVLDKLKAGQSEKPKKTPARFSMLRLGSKGYRVKALQQKLCELGYHVQPDGDFGPATRRAIVAFQIDNGLKTDGLVGTKTQAALDRAVPIGQQPGNSRSDLSVKDLRKQGSQTVKQADHLTLGGLLALLFGSAGELSNVQTDGWLGFVSNLIGTAKSRLGPVFSFVDDHRTASLILAGLFLVYVAHRIKQRRLSDAKEWRHVG
jgi:hypothetical protein